MKRALPWPIDKLERMVVKREVDQIISQVF